MNFEEVLPLMRKGKKARHGRMKDGEYWIYGHACFNEKLKIMKDVPKWPTLIKIYDNPFEDEKNADFSSYSWGIERWAIVADDWEIVE